MIWVNIGSGNGLLPDGTKPLPEPMLTDHQWSPVTFILEKFLKRCLNHQSLNLFENDICLKFHSNFSWTNELPVVVYLKGHYMCASSPIDWSSSNEWQGFHMGKKILVGWELIKTWSKIKWYCSLVMIIRKWWILSWSMCVINKG